MEKDVYQRQKELINEKSKSLKSENNVVHLTYIDAITENDLENISKSFSAVGLELSSFNSSRIITNSIDDFSFITYLVLRQPIILELLKGLGTNAAWDAVKQTIIFVRNKIFGKKYFRVTSNTTDEKEITFGIKVHLDENTGFDFELKGDLNNEVINQSLDKILDFLKTQKVNPRYVHPLYVKYSTKANKWIPIDVIEELRRKKHGKKK